MNARKIIPNPVVAKRRQVILPKTINMKAPAIGTFADCATGMDEEMINQLDVTKKASNFQIN